MEFDKTRVYTAVNADELKVGSKCYFADRISFLKECLEHNAPSETLVKIHDESFIGRFDSNTTENCILVYLIEPPKEPEYKPFSSVEKAKEAIDKHGGWVKSKNGDVHLIICYSFDNVLVAGKHIVFYDELLQYFVFADDGSPCGELVEE
ncbi:MAG: hypothetical protein P1P65_00680 [Treponema sp.]